MKIGSAKMGSARKNNGTDWREGFEVRHDPVWDLPADNPPAARGEARDGRLAESRVAALEDELRGALETQAALARRVEQLETIVLELRAAVSTPAPAPTRKRAAAPTATATTARTRRNSTKTAIGE